MSLSNLFSLTGILFCAATSFAAEPEELFKSLDKDKDGVITEDEVSTLSKRHFDRLLRLGDRDFDGKLTLDEFKFGSAEPQQAPAPGGQFAGRGPGRNMAQNFDPSRIFQFLDRNRDDRLEYSELPEQAQRRMKPLFDRIGKDVITKEEFTRISSFRPGNPNQGSENQKSMDMKKSEPTATGKSDSKRKDDSKTGPTPANGDRRPVFSMIVRRYDRNNDGSLSKSEAPDRMKRNFDRIDSNSDGKITTREFEQMISRMQSGNRKPKQK